MNLFDIVVSDPCWSFSDELNMSSAKRGAKANYNTLSTKDIIDLDVKSIMRDNSILALWVPSALLKEGIEVMEAWGFKLKQTHIWVKVKKQPLKSLLKGLFKIKSYKDLYNQIKTSVSLFDLNNILDFKMGHIFRGTHEILLIGTRGKVSKMIKNKSQRSVHFAPVTKHSEKPEALQDMLEIMYPNTKKLEMFARRKRENWICIGNEAPDTYGEDIRVSLANLKNM